MTDQTLNKCSIDSASLSNADQEVMAELLQKYIAEQTSRCVTGLTYLIEIEYELEEEEESDPEAKCRYCGGNCPNDEENACDGYLGDPDGLYAQKGE